MKWAGNKAAERTTSLFSPRGVAHYIKQVDVGWAAVIVLLVAGLSIPILTILLKLFEGPGESWGHIVEFLLADYVINSCILALCAGSLALAFGIGPAWIVSRYEFPFRRLFEWLLIIPLAIPNYLTAYAYAGLFDYGGLIQQIIASGDVTSSAGRINIMNIWGLSFVLASSLYPYVYVTTRSFFLNQSSTQLSTALLLGAGEARVFWKVALPMARPAIAAGLFLVLMEVLNDYGAAYYFGVPTFTTAIFRSWFGLGEPDTSIYLSALLCLFVLMLIFAERFQRRKKGYDTRRSDTSMPRKALLPLAQWGLLMVCLIPIAAGFGLPFGQMIYWGSITWTNVLDSSYFSIVGYSVLLAAITALLCVCISYVLIYGSKWSRSQGVKHLSKIAISGYAVPGVVIAVGIIIPGLMFDKWLLGFMQEYVGVGIGFVINGTLVGLILAYCVRFMAVSYNPIEANSKKVGESVSYASQVLGASKWRRTFFINMPLLQKGLWSGALLVFVDVMKELPITLLLKPYGVMTLSAKAYEFASDERIAESAVPSLMIIAAGLLPIIFLNKLIRS